MGHACRLMCAASDAYGITASEDSSGNWTSSFSPQAPFHSAVGWLPGAPDLRAGGFEQTDACLIGASSDGLVIAFRGTEAPSSNDWHGLWDWLLKDFFTTPIDPGYGIAGKVHAGFWESLNNLWDGIQEAAQHASGNGLPIYITGHSKGAGIAPLAAARLAAELSISAAGVYIFAPPNCGDSDFVTGFPSDIPVVSYKNYLDIIPFLPPTPAFLNDIEDSHKFFYDLLKGYASDDYASIGTLNYIDQDGNVQTGSDIPSDLDRFNPIAADVPFDVSDIAAAHCHGCKATTPSKCAGGYMQGACDGTVCDC